MIENNFRENGILVFDKIFEDYELDDITRTIDKNRHLLNNNIIEADGLDSIGLIEKIFNTKIRSLINSLLPCGVLWHCQFRNTPSGNTNPHFAPNTEMGTWHKDREFDYRHERIDFLDIMIYLNDVGENDGAFAFLPKRPDKKISNSESGCFIYGNKGTVIASRIDWYHTATPNSGNTDRDIIRLSLQHNAFDNPLLNSDAYLRLAEKYCEKDKFLNFIFGGNRSWTKKVCQPNVNYEKLDFKLPTVNKKIELPLKIKLRRNVNNLKQILKFRSK